MKTSKLCVTGLCVGNSPVTGEFPAQKANNTENVSIWWNHRVQHYCYLQYNQRITYNGHALWCFSVCVQLKIRESQLHRYSSGFRHWHWPRLIASEQPQSIWANILHRSKTNTILPKQSTTTHWSWVTHICASNVTIIGSDSGLSPGQHQAIIWTNSVLLSIGPLRTNFSQTVFKIQMFLFKKMHLKMLSGNCSPFVSDSLYYCISWDMIYIS